VKPDPVFKCGAFHLAALTSRLFDDGILVSRVVDPIISGLVLYPEGKNRLPDCFTRLLNVELAAMAESVKTRVGTAFCAEPGV
jgi:hypothetical protein